MVEGMAAELKDAQTIEQWICGINDAATGESVLCVTKTYGGTLATSMGSDTSVDEVVENSKAFIEAWK